jgi:hypothetical protein
VETADTDSNVLFFATSPYGNIDAIVENDGRTLYFYLQGDRSIFGTRACWVRNLVEGPMLFNREDLQRGMAPILPRTHLMNPRPAQPPKAEDLSVVWFPEGNGAALVEQDAILAVIPPWSGVDGFHGYARECAAENEIVWPMPPNGVLEARVDFARSFWNDWTEGQLFQREQPRLIEYLTKRFGTNHRYFAIDGGNFPTRGLGVFDDGDQTVVATVGMSLCPMPNVEMYVEDSRQVRRIELAIRLPVPHSHPLVESAARRMSSLAAMPWHAWTWFGDQHTCDWTVQPGFTKARMLADPDTAADPITMIHGDPVRLLWLVPE